MTKQTWTLNFFFKVTIFKKKYLAVFIFEYIELPKASIVCLRTC